MQLQATGRGKDAAAAAVAPCRRRHRTNDRGAALSTGRLIFAAYRMVGKADNAHGDNDSVSTRERGLHACEEIATRDQAIDPRAKRETVNLRMKLDRGGLDASPMIRRRAAIPSGPPVSPSTSATAISSKWPSRWPTTRVSGPRDAIAGATIRSTSRRSRGLSSDASALTGNQLTPCLNLDSAV